MIESFENVNITKEIKMMLMILVFNHSDFVSVSG